MKIDAIELEGFQSYIERERVALTGVNLAAVIGPNHVGKSTIVADALMYALFGSSRGAVINDVIARGAQKATVTLEFTAQDTKYRIVRFRTRKGRSEATLYVADPDLVGGWRDLTEKNPASADEQLRTLIGMNAVTARLTWMIGQGDFGAFCDMRPTDRRRVLAEAFDLGQYTQLQSIADTRRAQFARKLDTVSVDEQRTRERIEKLHDPGPFPMLDDEELESAGKDAEAAAEVWSRRLANLDDPSIHKRLDDARHALSSFEQSHRVVVEQHHRARSQSQEVLTHTATAVASAEGELKAAQDAQWQLRKATERVEESQIQVRDAEAAVATARAAAEAAASEPTRLATILDSITSTASEVGEQIETLKAGITKGSGVCYTCGQGLSDEDARILIEAKGRQTDELRTSYRQKSQERAAAVQQVADSRGLVAEAESGAVAARERLRQAESSSARVENLAGAVERLTQLLEETKARHCKAASDLDDHGEEPAVDQDQHDRLTAAVSEAVAAAAESEAGTGRRDEFAQKTQAARDESRRMWQEVQRRQAVASELAELRPRLTEYTKTVKTLTGDVATHALLVEAFKPAGIPSMILAGVVEELNEDANEILGFLGDDGLGVNVSTQREKAGGGVDEKVMIYALTAQGSTDYKTLSGSEKLRVALAVRLGLAKCIARRTGSPVQTIVMDEGWGALDEVSKHAVQDVLTRLSSEFAVLTVSHIEDVRSAFPTVIEVSAETGTSRCEVRSVA